MKDFFRSWGLLLIALALGALTFLFMNTYLSNKEKSLRDALLGNTPEARSVVVATKDIAVGDIAGSHNMAIAEIPVDHLSSAAVAPDDFSLYENEVLKYPMSRGEPLLSYAVDGKVIARFSDLIIEGNRAVTIEVDAISSNSGLLVVGDFVDISVSGEFMNTTSGKKEDAYVALFQKIKVLAIDRHPLLSKQQDFRYDMVDGIDKNRNQIDYDTVTLSVKNDAASTLAFAAEVGDIRFFLRNSKDEGVTPPQTMTEKLFGVGNINKKSEGAYLYISATSTNKQSVRPLLTLSDSIVNKELRDLNNQKSMPILQENRAKKNTK